MKRNRIIVFVVIVLALVTLAACNTDEQTNQYAWVETLENVGECQSIKFEQTVENGDLLLSSCTQNFAKATDGWAYEKTEKILNDDAFATEKYEITTTTGTVEQAPYLKLDKTMIEKFEKEESDDQTKYDVAIYAAQIKAFLGLSDEEVAKVSDLDIEVTIQNGKVVKTEIEYKVSGKEVTQTLTYVY